MGLDQFSLLQTKIRNDVPSFVKIEKAPVNVVIDYYGAKIQTDHNNLACVLAPMPPPSSCLWLKPPREQMLPPMTTSNMY